MGKLNISSVGSWAEFPLAKMSINLWHISVSPESVGRHVAELTGPCRYTGLYGESLKGNWTWYFNFCLMNVGGNKGRNGGGERKKEKNRERKAGRKSGEERRKKQREKNRIKVSCILLVLFPPAWVPQVHNVLNRYSLLWTHPWHRLWDKAGFWPCCFPLLRQGCFGPFVCGNLIFFLLMLEKQSNGQFHTVLVPARNRNCYMHFNKDKGRSWFLIIGFKASESKVFSI